MHHSDHTLSVVVERGGNNEASKRVFAQIRPLQFSTNTSLRCTACTCVCRALPPSGLRWIQIGARRSPNPLTLPPFPTCFVLKGHPVLLRSL